MLYAKAFYPHRLSRWFFKLKQQKKGTGEPGALPLGNAYSKLARGVPDCYYNDRLGRFVDTENYRIILNL